MVKNILNTCQGDLLEFDIQLMSPDPPEGSTCQPGKKLYPRPLYEGEKLFFTTDADNNGNFINIEQADIHFKISEVILTPGQYPFRAGIIYSTGDRQTVFSSGDSVLVVRRP